MHHHAPSCTIMHQHAPSCTIMHHHAPSCIKHNHAPSWTTFDILFWKWKHTICSQIVYFEVLFLFILSGGGVVSTRAHVHYIVTEYGIVNLFGKNLRQRAYELIRIAHPDHREGLEKAAFERLKVIPSPWWKRLADIVVLWRISKQLLFL